MGNSLARSPRRNDEPPFTHTYRVHQYFPVPGLKGFTAPETMDISVTNTVKKGATRQEIRDAIEKKVPEHPKMTLDGYTICMQCYGGQPMDSLMPDTPYRSGIWLYLEDRATRLCT